MVLNNRTEVNRNKITLEYVNELSLIEEKVRAYHIGVDNQ